MNKKLFFTIVLTLIFTTLFAQIQKKPLSHDVYDGWKSVDYEQISDNGNWVLYELNPQEGDGSLIIKNIVNEKSINFTRGKKAKVSPNELFTAFIIKPQHDTIRQLKVKKVKKTKYPKDSIGIYIFEKDTCIKFSDVKSFNIPQSETDWLVIHFDKSEKNDNSSNDSKKENKKKKKSKKEKLEEEKQKKIDEKKKKQEGTKLLVYEPVNDLKYEFENISEYDISYNGKTIGFISNIKDSLDSTAVFIFDTYKKTSKRIFYEKGLAKKINIDRTGRYCSFIFTADTSKTKVYSLYFVDLEIEKPVIIADTLTDALPEKWTVNENSRIFFSRDSKRLFFGTAPKPEKQKKDTIPEDEKYQLTVWSYKDPYLQSQQELDLEKEKKRTYLAVYNILNNKTFQLEDTVIIESRLSMEGNGKYALGFNPVPYAYKTQWEFPEYNDIYLINLDNGEKTLISKECRNIVGLSPECHFIYWYDYDDKNWFVRSVEAHDTICLTKNIGVNFYNEEEDVPNVPKPYGIAGWYKGDQRILIYDMYDIWEIDPLMEQPPVCLTSQYGRNNNLKFNYVKLDEEAFSINQQEDMLLSCFDEKTKNSGFYYTGQGFKSPVKLLMENYSFNKPVKAKKANIIIWKKGNFRECYELYSSDTKFNNIKKHSDLSKQIEPFLWGSVELIKWDSPNKKDNEGLLYKPENFDPSKKYPMIVYFYEKYSDQLNRFYEPKPSRSVINFPYYVSNGYVIFVPDIHYKTGQPGKDALTTVVSGTDYLIQQGFVDEEHIGIQGQSWGGYQVAYIVTQTDKFKAAMAGAPVSNMTSAYGGIRWESGMSRQFQYEVAQSRIGCTLWEDREKYIENSPVFFADKVNTPLLIMHNDNDGAVPWYQGIELFTALKRLGKPVWMLSYNNEEHNLKKRPNCKDLTIRMSQFFDHYLKDKPEPIWMKKGIPAIKKGIIDGYKYINE
ncbi:MAG: prolyl oligopeptidase family serine peptidase [Marinilabiliales bacterium]